MMCDGFLTRLTLTITPENPYPHSGYGFWSGQSRGRPGVTPGLPSPIPSDEWCTAILGPNVSIFTALEQEQEGRCQGAGWKSRKSEWNGPSEAYDSMSARRRVSCP